MGQKDISKLIKMKKNHEIRITCSAEEHETIKKKAEKVFMKMSAYCKWLALNSNIKVETQ